MSLYLLINISSILLPLIYSFHKKIEFYKKWKTVFPALVISAGIFIYWDVIFTNDGVWGFNVQYLAGVNILNLPLEEWMFFFFIPYACLFTHFTLTKFYPNLLLSLRLTRIIGVVLMVVIGITVLLNTDKAYTFINGMFGVLLLAFAVIRMPQILRSYFLTYLVILIPFFIVNGILTGSFIEGEVVWYNNSENLGIRLFTIPVEDTLYGFTLILLNLILVEVFSKRSMFINRK